jgi:hypothetical protein
MTQTPRPIESLSVEDTKANPVWEFVDDEEGRDESWVRPAENPPFKDLNRRVAAAIVQFANGSSAWALIGNIDTCNPRYTEHFLTLSIEREGSWFNLARYFDHDYQKRGPAALATFLQSQVDDIFPIRFDLRHCAIGDAASLIGSVQEEPKERLTRGELLKMAVP